MQPRKPVVLSSSSHPIPKKHNYHTRFTALSDTLITSYESETATHNLTTNQPGPSVESKSRRHPDYRKLALPDNKFAILDQATLEIYCSNSMKRLQSITLPFAADEFNKQDSQLEIQALFVTSDQKVLIIQTNIVTVVVTQEDAKHIVVGNKFDYVDFFLDLQTYQIVRRKQDQKQRQITWLGDGHYVLFVRLHFKPPIIEVRSIHSDKVMPCKMSRGDFFEIMPGRPDHLSAIYATPQHPSVWLVAEDMNHRNTVYVYDVKKSAEQFTLTRGKKIIDMPKLYWGHHLEMMTFPNSFVYRDNETDDLWEINLNQLELQQIEIPGYTDLKLQCQFPDGRLGLSARDEGGKHFFIAVKLASVRELADRIENELVETMDSVFISATRPQGMPKPLQRIIAGYTSRFFAVSDEADRAATVRERHDTQPEPVNARLLTN